MRNLFESFRSFVLSENDRNAFLSSHFKNPEESTTFLVFADWLDEHDQPGLAKVLRAIVKGHDQKDYRSFNRNIENALMDLWRNSNVIDTDYARMRFYIHDDPKTYRITPEGIESGVRVLKKLPEKKWTDEIVNAAIFVLIQHYLQLPVMRFRNDLSVYDIDRPQGMNNRVIESLTNQITHLLNSLDGMLVGLVHGAIYPNTIRSIREDFDYLYQLFNRWNSITDGKDLNKDFPGLCLKARRLDELLLALQRTINNNYGFLVARINWVDSVHDLITPEMITVQNKIQKSCG